MAFWQIKESGKYVAAQKEFVCDTADELSTIAGSVADALIIGDLATVIATGKQYMYNGSGEWVEQPAAGGGGGSGGGSNLPDVTADDNGDVLTVVEGAWTNAAPSGGAQVLFIDAGTYDSQTERVPTNKSYNDVISCLSSGGIAFLRDTQEIESNVSVRYGIVLYAGVREEGGGNPIYTVEAFYADDIAAGSYRELSASSPTAMLSYPD